MLRYALAFSFLVPLAEAQTRATDAPRKPAFSTGLGSPAAGGQEMFLSTPSGDIYRVDNYATTPTAVLLGNPGLGSLGDIAWDPTSNDFVVLVFLGDVYRVDPVTMAATLIGSPGATDLNALEIDSAGNLYARGFSGFDLWSIDPNTGVTTAIGDTGISSSGDLAMDVDGLNLVGTTSLEDVDEIDSSDGSAVLVGPTNIFSGGLAYGIEVDTDGTVYILTDIGEVYTYDRTNQSPTLIGPLANFLDEVWGCTFRLNPVSGEDIGTSYCGPANSNSSGQSAEISAFGSTTASLNSVRLDAIQMATNEFGYFVNSMTQGFVIPPGSQGNLCLGGGIGRHTANVMSTGAGGAFSLQLDLTAVPTPSGNIAVQPGETWYWQAWFRDNNPSSTNNFTDGICITFQ